MDLDDRRRMRQNWRGRRLLACRFADELSEVIEALGVEDGSELPPAEGFPAPPTDQQKLELQNATAVLLRMVLQWNDGHVSPSKLQRF